MVQLLVRLMRCIGLLLGVLQLGTKACTARLQACVVQLVLLLCCRFQLRQLHLEGRKVEAAALLLGLHFLPEGGLVVLKLLALVLKCSNLLLCLGQLSLQSLIVHLHHLPHLPSHTTANTGAALQLPGVLQA
jgi:hypothetical protein